MLAANILPRHFYFTLNIQPYLVFHNITEIFSVIVAISIFVTGWFAQEHSKDQKDLLISSAFLSIGLIDFMHALSYAGMPDFITANSVNKGAQFWLVARFLTALTLFLISVPIKNRNLFSVKTPLLFMSFAVSGAAFTAIVYFPEFVPDAYRAGEGLTTFKKAAEFGMVIILALAAVFHIAAKSREHDSYLAAAMVFSVLSELAFALYDSAYDSFILTGHIYKIVAFALIYRSLFVSCIKNPHRRIVSLNRRLAYIAQKHREAERKTAMLSREITRASEIERADLADVLHESLSQRLVMATLALKSQPASSHETALRDREKILDPIRRALEISRRVASRLSPAHLKTIGLVLAIEDLLQDFNKTGKYRISAQLDALHEYFPGDWNNDLYRIVQEALNNIEKHAQADEIVIRAERLASGLKLTIADNGRAGAPVALDTATGIGIPMMQQRAQALGGNLRIERHDAGFGLVLALPINAGTERV